MRKECRMIQSENLSYKSFSDSVFGFGLTFVF